MSNPQLLANEDITAETVRLIHPDGANEITDINTALSARLLHSLDLVQMNDDDIPVCKLIDLSRHIYDMKMAEKNRKKKQRETAVKTKEIQLSIEIQDHDANIKQKQVRKFLDAGDQCRIALRLTGRARGNHAMQQLAIDKVNAFIQNIGAFTFTQAVTNSGDTVSVIVKNKGL